LTIAHGSMVASNVVPPIPETSYILISPLLWPISAFSSFFSYASDNSILSGQRAGTHGTSVQKILVIYGEGDTFAISTARYRRHLSRVQSTWQSKIQVKEIQNGGHFWEDIRSQKTLVSTVAAFIQI
jgi:hypothetical protein